MIGGGGITTHVLDTTVGRPAAGISVTLARVEAGTAVAVGAALSDADGRISALLPAGYLLELGTYRLTFDTSAYFRVRAIESFYPEVSILFEVRDASEHHHVPLLLSPFGYSTYRGS